MPSTPEDLLAQEAVLLAEEWLTLSNQLLTGEEKKLQRRMASLRGRQSVVLSS